MRFRDGRRSVCVSSQSGCPLTCTFCATGQMQFRRNLTQWEMLDQALHFRRIEPIDHVVFMGMGEPMLNVDAVLAAARRLPDLGVTPPADDDLDRRLAARADALHRRGLRADPARALAARADRRPAQPDHAGQRPLPARGRARRVPPLLRAAPPQGVHRVRDARRASTTRASTRVALAELLDRDVFKVNLIPYNPTGMYDGSSRDAIARVQVGARRGAAAVDGAADPRPRHRRRLRAARRDGVAVTSSSSSRPTRRASTTSAGSRPAGSRASCPTTGRAQAAQLGERRRNDGIDLVVSSDLRRAVETVGDRVRRLGAPDPATTRGCASATTATGTACRAPGSRPSASHRIDVPFPGGESWREAVAAARRLPRRARRRERAASACCSSATSRRAGRSITC